MAYKKFQKGSEEWTLFMEFWNLCQKYWEVEDNDKYWKELTESAIDFGEKYDSDVFGRKLALAFLETQTEKSKSKKMVETPSEC